MLENIKLIVVKLVNIPDIYCVLRLDFEIFRQNPFVSDTSEVPIILPLHMTAIENNSIVKSLERKNNYV